MELNDAPLNQVFWVPEEALIYSVSRPFSPGPQEASLLSPCFLWCPLLLLLLDSMSSSNRSLPSPCWVLVTSKSSSIWSSSSTTVTLLETLLNWERRGSRTNWSKPALYIHKHLSDSYFLLLKGSVYGVTVVSDCFGFYKCTLKSGHSVCGCHSPTVWWSQPVHWGDQQAGS